MFGMWDAVMAMIIKKSPIKSIQSGITTAAGDVTINAVNTTKTIVLSASKGSAGYVAARGNIALTPTPSSFPIRMSGDYNTQSTTSSWPSYNGSITEGSTDLTVKVYSAKLTNSTTLYCDGPVEWQVIEFA